ncbi:C2 domain [Pseudocohnilembus persalinus]|uniref:C2 domain n=1 Tax=Pseudocohnilembus persalinus TaxID=266149 RepID=A0A0V0R285_PSEPJ|nr:C2 domain [Pseudocohnilembus persalinus]|eukprot:KRX08280.1 C2 domain [Pseudocohnilembus persalinus]
MGCGTSIEQHSKVNNKKKQFQNPCKGTVKINVKNAKILREFKSIGQPNPYVEIIYEQQKFQTKGNTKYLLYNYQTVIQKQIKVCMGGGSYPIWDQLFEFKKKTEEDIIYFNIFSKQIGSIDEFIGQGAIRKGYKETKKNVAKIFSKGKIIGLLNVEYYFEIQQSSIDHPIVSTPNTSGNLVVEPIKININQQIKQIYGNKANLYVLARVNNEQQQTKIDFKNNFSPEWDQKLVLKKSHKNSDLITLELWNFQTQYNDELIGIAYISISPVLIIGVGSYVQQPMLFLEDQKIGSVVFTLTFFTDEPEEYNKLQHFNILKNNQVQFLSDIPQSGQNQHKYQNGDDYEGEFLNKKKNGNGKCIYACQQIYDGYWKDDLWHGQGSLQVGELNIQGTWQNGIMNGFFIIKWGEDLQFQGIFQQNKPEGNCRWIIDQNKTLNCYYKQGYQEMYMGILQNWGTFQILNSHTNEVVWSSNPQLDQTNYIS